MKWGINADMIPVSKLSETRCDRSGRTQTDRRLWFVLAARLHLAVQGNDILINTKRREDLHPNQSQNRSLNINKFPTAFGD